METRKDTALAIKLFGRGHICLILPLVVATLFGVAGSLRADEVVSPFPSSSKIVPSFTTSSKVVLADETALTGNFTVEYWVSPSRATNWRLINSTESVQYGIAHTKENQLAFWGPNLTLNLSQDLATQEWSHFALVREDGVITAYVNGIEAGSGSWDGEIRMDSIGGRSTGSSYQAFAGLAMELRFWNHARSSEEIQDHLNRRLSGQEAGLEGYWPMDEGSGTAVGDRSSTANSGVAEALSWVAEAEAELLVLSLRNPATESLRFTNTNVANVAWLAAPSGYSHYQISDSDDVGDIDDSVEGWVSVDNIPAQVSFDQPWLDGRFIKMVWFTNLTSQAELAWGRGIIYHTDCKPSMDVSSATTRHLVEGYSTVVLNFDDVDTGTTGGEANGREMRIASWHLSCEKDTTPELPEVTLAEVGEFEVVLTVVNEAGNSACATSTVTVVEGELRTWSGLGNDTLASNPDNWTGGILPITGNSIIFDDTSDKDCTWDLGIAISEWSQTADYAGTITFATVYPGQGTFTNLIIGRDADIQGGVWTHEANPVGELEVNRLAVTVGGDFTLGAAASINLDGRGFATASGPGAGTAGSTTSGYAASHGGAGARNLAGSGTYGSATRPENLGSGAYDPGGGALLLGVGGQAVIDGLISAQGVKNRTDSASYNHGSGGSILIFADGFGGEGIVRAGVDLETTAYYGSGGGRVALISGSEDDFSGLTITANTHTQTRDKGGRAGTIYLETPTSKRLIIDQNNIGSASDNHTDIPARKVADVPSYAFGGELADVTLVAINGARVGVAHDLRIGDIEWLEGTFSLNGRTLYVVADAPAGVFPNEYGNATITPSGVAHTFENSDTLSRDGRLLWSDAPVTWRAVSVAYQDEGGATTINDSSSEGYFVPGSGLTFAAIPDTGYSFLHWDGTIEGATSSDDNPFSIDSIGSNLFFRAWFRDDSLDSSTNIWAVPSANDDWFDPLNWSQYTVPEAGQTVVVPSGASMSLTNATPKLGGFYLAGGAKLTSVGWESRIEADEIVVAGEITHLPQVATAPDPITEEWLPNSRIWLKGGKLTVTETGVLNADYLGYIPGAGPGAGILGSGYSCDSGGGYGGNGGAAFGGTQFGVSYGEADDPWQPGSGAGTSATGRPGGGAIRIEMDGRVVVDGTITANGQKGAVTLGGGGSGGGIAIYCDTFQGSASGLISVDGGRCDRQGGSGGGGRIAIHYNPAAQTQLTDSRPPVKISAYAWFDSSMGHTYPVKAQMGTLYITDTTLLADSPTAAAVLDRQRFWQVRLYIGSNLESWAPQSLVISNCIVGFPPGFTLEVADNLDIGSGLPALIGEDWERAGLALWAEASEELYGGRLLVGGNLNVGENSWIYPRAEGYSRAVVGLRVDGSTTIAAGGGIDADARGLYTIAGNSNGLGAGGDNESGGGYGGRGGGKTQSKTYGLAAMPLEYGSPGGYYNYGGPFCGGTGGGSIVLLSGGDVVLDGTLSANGGEGNYYRGPGGSGGSIFVVAGGRFSGNGLMSAKGGQGAASNRAPGGGGRIAVWHHIPLATAEQRIAALDVSGLGYSESVSPFSGVCDATTTETTISGYLDGEPGTFGFYTMQGTLIILR